MITDRRVARASASLDLAAQAAQASREAAEHAADVPVGEEQRRLRTASRVLQDVSHARILEAGRHADGRSR